MADFNPGAGSLLALRRLTGGMVTPASGPEEMAVPEPAPGPAEMAVPPIGRMPAEPMPPFAPGVPLVSSKTALCPRYSSRLVVISELRWTH